MARDNHAGKIDMHSWVAGFFDGEGFVTIRHTYITASKCYVYQPAIVFTNTDKNVLEILFKWLKENGCESNFHSRNQHLKNPKWKPTYDVTMYGMKRVQKFIDLIGDFCIVKKPQIDLVREFIEYRLTGNQRKKYGDFEKNIFERIKNLKHDIHV